MTIQDDQHIVDRLLDRERSLETLPVRPTKPALKTLHRARARRLERTAIAGAAMGVAAVLLLGGGALSMTADSVWAPTASRSAKSATTQPSDTDPAPTYTCAESLPLQVFTRHGGSATAEALLRRPLGPDTMILDPVTEAANQSIRVEDAQGNYGTVDITRYHDRWYLDSALICRQN